MSTNKWTEYIKIFDSVNVSSIDVKFIKETKEYIIFSVVNTKAIMVKLDENFNVKNSSNVFDNCYTEQSLQSDDCNYIKYYDFYYSDINNNYNVIGGCTDSYTNNEMLKECNVKLENNVTFYNDSISSDDITKEEERTEELNEEKEIKRKK